MASECRSDFHQLRKWTLLPHRRKLSFAVQNRWSLWARSLATRHLRLAPCRDLLDLVVAHPRSLVRILRERWLVTSRWVQPRIELAIHAILNLTVNQRHSVIHNGAQSTSVASQGNATFPNTTKLSNRDSFLRSVPSALSTQGKAHAPGNVVDKKLSPNPNEVVASAAAPLTLVFRRVHETQRLTHSRVLEALMDQREHSIVRRVVRRSRRSETMITTAPNLPDRQTVSMNTEAIPSHSMKLAAITKLTPAAVKVFEQSTTTHPATLRVETLSGQKESTLLPDLNLDQITDQVVRRLDRRVIALRERMGRV